MALLADLQHYGEMIKPPAREGIPAATLHLPPGTWSTVLDCLAAHFPTISRDEWSSRFERGMILGADGRVLSSDTTYREGLRVHYYREVPLEVPIPFRESIVYADAHLIVADKPHFLPVSPVGSYVRETLLTRLQQRFSNPQLTPLHRIDRGTAGLVMFSANPATRAAYQALFRERRIRKRYEALASPLPAMTFPLERRSRIVRGEPFVRSCEIAGEPNTQTRIELMDTTGSHWRYALFPLTGKKHQLRVHMAALGAPIVNDDFYPDMRECAPNDFTRPLQLLARELAFEDPVTAAPRCFCSALQLHDV